MTTIEPLPTDATLAGIFGVPEKTVANWRNQYGWECTRIGRRIYYTEAQIQGIIASHRDRVGSNGSGQTARSRAAS